MSLSKTEAQQLLERLIFEETSPQDWAQDVWDLSPMHGDSAVKLLEIFLALVETCPDDKLETLTQSFYRDKLEQSL